MRSGKWDAGLVDKFRCMSTCLKRKNASKQRDMHLPEHAAMSLLSVSANASCHERRQIDDHVMRQDNILPSADLDVVARRSRRDDSRSL
jgi:hypothetical protein